MGKLVNLQFVETDKIKLLIHPTTKPKTIIKDEVICNLDTQRN